MRGRFRDTELARFERSGWCRIDPLAAALPGIDPGRFLRGRPAAWWFEAAEIAEGLREKIAAFRFADDAESGLLFVPPVSVLDTRLPVDAPIRGRSGPIWPMTSQTRFSVRAPTSSRPARREPSS